MELLEKIKNHIPFRRKNDENELIDLHPRRHEFRYLWAAFGIPAFLMLVIWFCMEIRPINPAGNSTVLFLDASAQYVSFFETLRHMIYGDASYLYSFSRSLGGEFMGMYAYYLASPFSYLVALFPQSRIIEAITFIFLLKTGFCGVTFAWYLHKTTEKFRQKLQILLFSTMYALTTYCVVYQHNTMWIDAVIWLPVIVYGVEELVKHGKFKRYVFFLALTVCSNFYIGYMVCLFVFLYFFTYYFGTEPKERNPQKERHHFLRTFCRIGLWSVLAIGIAALILLTTYYSMQFGKTTYTDPSFKAELKVDFLDLLSKFLPGAYDEINTQSGLPLLYCGTLTLLLVPVWFMSPRVKARRKLTSGLLILFFLTSFTFSTLILVWHCFQYPICLNDRNSFLLCFYLLVLAYRGLLTLRKKSSAMLWGTCGVLSLCVILLQKIGPDFLGGFKNILFALGALILLTAVLNLLISAARKWKIRVVLLCVVCVELFGSGLICMADMDEEVGHSGYARYTSYLSEARAATNAVLDSDPGFYRMERTTFRHKNDNMALMNRGLGGSTSTLNKETLTFLDDLGYAAQSHWCRYYTGSVVNDSLLGIKYILSDNDLSEFYELYYQDDHYSVWKNPYALSLAFGASADVRSFKPERFNKNPFEYMNRLVTALLGRDTTVELFVPVEMDLTDCRLVDCSRSANGTDFEFYNTGSSKGSLIFTLNVPVDTELFFYIPCDNDRYFYGVKVYVNDSGTSTLFGDKNNRRILSLGTFAEEEMKLKLTLDGKRFYADRWSSLLWTVDKDVWREVMTALSETSLSVEPGFKDDKLKGSLTTAEDGQLIFTTLPYDEGWKILVDGKRVPIEKVCDALIAFEVPVAGEHTVVLKYRPKVFFVGLGITLLSLTAFALCVVFEKKLNGVRRIGWIFGCPDKTEAASTEETVPYVPPEPDTASENNGSAPEQSTCDPSENGG